MCNPLRKPVIKDGLSQKEIRELWEQFLESGESREYRIKKRFYTFDPGTKVDGIMRWFNLRFDYSICNVCL